MTFRSFGFCGGRKTREPKEKPSEQDKNQQQTHPTWSGFKLRPHWWERSALATASSLSPKIKNANQILAN